MRKTVLAICIALLCVMTALVIYATPTNPMSPQDSAKARCRKGCAEKKDSCLSNAQAADEANTRARRNACYEDYTACLEACDK